MTTVGQRHDSVAFELVLGKVAVARVGSGRSRTRPDYTLADKAYSSRSNREYLAKRGIKAVIPIKADQAAGRARRGSRGGRPPVFGKVRYRQRNTVERSVNKLQPPEPWPPATPSATTSTAAPSRPRQSGSGCATPSRPRYGTRPSAVMIRSPYVGGAASSA